MAPSPSASSTRRDQRGQVGIGTLIVFIAVILVAAITATVLLNVVGDLKEQAESTGEESTETVSTGVRVISVVGTVDGSGSGIETLTVNMKLRPGSDDVDLSQTVMRYVDPDTTRHLTHSAASPADLQGGEFNVTGIKDAGDPSTYVMNHPRDIYALQLNLTEIRGAPLPAGESARLRVSPPNGVRTDRTVRVPPVLDPAGESMNLNQ